MYNSNLNLKFKVNETECIVNAFKNSWVNWSFWVYVMNGVEDSGHFHIQIYGEDSFSSSEV